MKKAIPFIIGGAVLSLAVIAAGIWYFIVPWFGNIHPDFLTSHTWEACYGNNPCVEILRLDEHGGFSHHCGCGEPVRDYDLYELYTYDMYSDEIDLYGYGITKMKVVYHNSEYLFIEYADGTFRPFINENAKSIIGEPWVMYEELETAPLCTNIAELKDNKLTLLPYGYDGIANGEYNGEDYTAPLSDDVTVVAIQLVEKYGEDFCQKEVILLEEALVKDDRGFTEAYVNINDDGEIDKIIIYNSTTTEE